MGEPRHRAACPGPGRSRPIGAIATSIRGAAHLQNTITVVGSRGLGFSQTPRPCALNCNEIIARHRDAQVAAGGGRGGENCQEQPDEDP